MWQRGRFVREIAVDTCQWYFVGWQNVSKNRASHKVLGQWLSSDQIFLGKRIVLGEWFLERETNTKTNRF